MPEPAARQILRFDQFELDLAAYELRRQGRPVRLERLPMDLLVMLVERRSELVTRSEIVDRLWGKDVFVDVETGINTAVRTALSPRFVPDDIFAVAEVPRTLSGKKQELPIKKLLLGQPIEKVVNKDAMANPGCLDWYVAFAAERAQTLPAA